jgi:DNA mismatch repair protein MutS
VKEWKGEIIFLHEVIKGAADQSYGVHVAKLAGIPAPVIARSKQVLDILQKSETSGALSQLADDLPLFSSVVKDTENTKDAENLDKLKTMIDDLDPDALTPRDALDWVYKIKNI